jgi:hypothetical protein
VIRCSRPPARIQPDKDPVDDHHRAYLSDIGQGTRNVSLVNIERVAPALSLKISELFQGIE